ncbi:hypothetical protein [Accumulibacter sp.]|uniref:TraB/GumN family protein n=1 Tax=Accumulibacter regalis TaxID=522306 RepID=C7RTQ3_ACCRE|nr:hypothetical protein [Accumulibacter sp.]MBN8498433.1 hypothetical protein [Accumulibacter sp.]MBO3714823.1 hypothetical protein [Accumulibacter sp.]
MTTTKSTTTTSSTSNWSARLNGAFWLALILFALAGLLVVGKLPLWIVSMVVAAGVALGAILFLLRWLAKRRDPAYSPGRSFGAFALAGALGMLGLASLPVFYLAFWVQSGPTAVPLATLSNGQKTVVFQGMQHIGSEDFYKSVVFDLEQALADGYTLFYEGVTPVDGRPDLTDWFNQTLRGSKQDLSAGYKKMAEQCGLSFQLNYFDPIKADMAIHPSRHITADTNFLEMKTEYDRLLREDPAFAAGMAAKAAKAKQATSDPGGDPFALFLGIVEGATPEQKKLAGIVCRGVLGMAVSGALGEEKDPSNRIIVDFRNRALARFVDESKSDKIYITYGAAHFPGFFAELQKRDPKFAIRAVKGVRPMTLPDEVNLAPSAVSGSRG